MSISHKLRHVIAALALFVVTPPITAGADVIGITSIAELGPNADSFSWQSLGPAFRVLIGDQTVVSKGLKATIAGPPNNFAQGPATVDPPGVLQRLDQNNGWEGNFAPGTPLLWNVDAGFGITQSPLISVTFSAPVRGAGVQIQPDFFGAFQADAIPYNASNQQLGTFSELGNSTANGDGSAIFIGLLSLAPS